MRLDPAVTQTDQDG